jgi:hypothetical protein
VLEGLRHARVGERGQHGASGEGQGERQHAGLIESASASPSTTATVRMTAVMRQMTTTNR